ncbi:hypothetical protein QOZ80_6AG0547090 [Eleusine coracana subsp. coracana]|nr:hypothetical protein QOZ80_6AG0547090 [Eleusine coracana subsp. coracana]
MAAQGCRSGGGGVSLPEDIMFFDVLSRLPVKQLCRFRCVSKRWRALISDPAFVAAQKSRGPRLVVAVFGAPRKVASPVPYFLEKVEVELRVMDTDGNVLGVVEGVTSEPGVWVPNLLQARLDLVCVDNGPQGASIIDPLNGRVVRVGRLASPSEDYQNYFHRTWEQSTLARANPSNAYKIVRIGTTNESLLPGGSQICVVGTLGDPGVKIKWRQRLPPPVVTCVCCNCSRATINGVVHFLTREAHKRGSPPGWNRITSFDLESEEWKTTVMDGPFMGRPKEGHSWTVALVELNGTLGMVQNIWCRQKLRSSEINIWLLVDPEKSIWTRKYAIHVPRDVFLMKVLDVLDHGRVLLLTSFLSVAEKYRGLLGKKSILQLFDPNTSTFTDLVQMPKEFKDTMTLYTGDFLSCSKAVHHTTSNILGSR